MKSRLQLPAIFSKPNPFPEPSACASIGRHPGISCAPGFQETFSPFGIVTSWHGMASSRCSETEAEQVMELFEQKLWRTASR